MKKNYLKLNLFFVFLFFLSAIMYSQNGRSLWTQTTTDKVFSSKKLYDQIEPVNVSYFELNLNELKNSLVGVPKRGTIVSSVVLDFPNADGKMESFRIEEASNMEPELQAQFPDIRSYIGTGITNPRAILRFSMSPQKGLSSMVLSEKKTVFIEPYSEDLSLYRVYKRTSDDVKPSQFVCETEFLDQSTVDDFVSDTANRNADDGTLRTFRLALACTGEYATYHGGTVPDVVAAMNTTMTRVNGVFERDVAIRMVLVANNTNVIYLDAVTDPYTNDNGGAMLDQNQTACNTNIGSANYDIGHVFSTGGGGIAQLNSPCGSGKARGVTGQPEPVGDFFDIDYVAHEMGHQYGANHTQNNNCQRSAKSFEPGSASTIMGYAGICAPNVQNNSDDYFHGESIREMWNNITLGNSQCAAQSATNNSAPVANAGSNYTIPISTPFILKGSATDANSSDALTYCWEQLDATPATMPPVSTSTAGPAFRSLDPSTSPNRYMPALSTVLAGSTTSTWEVVPSVARTMNFNLTVRDNVANGGGTSSDGMTVTTVANAGPFVVTSQATEGISWEQGATETITWNVAGTTGNGVNTANVNILLSTDGGLTYDIVLANNVPNNGSYDITVPNIAEPYCRVMVEGAGNIFYNVNTVNFAIGYIVETTCTQYESGNINLPIPDGLGANVQGPVLSHSINVPDMAQADFVRVLTDISHTWVGDLVVQVTGPDTSLSTLYARNCNTGQDDLDVLFQDGVAPITCAATVTGTFSPVSALSVFTGVEAQGDWTIAMADFYNQDTGTLNNWYIEVCSTELIPLSIEENVFSGFSIFPNPNNGEFTIKLNSNSGEDIKVDVYDIRGRVIFNNVYSNTPDFNQTINLNNVQSGMYLVNVNDGRGQVTKKIIVD